MKRILTAMATMALALGVAAVPAQAEPAPTGSVLAVERLSAPAKTPGELYGDLTATQHAAKFTKKPQTPTAKAGGLGIVKGQPVAPRPPALQGQKAACTSGPPCYLYNGGRQDITTTLGTGTPKVSAYRGLNTNVKICGHSGALHGATDYHTLCEISASQSGTNGPNHVEIGATVDPTLNGDYQVRLFGFAWVDGQPTCYNGFCGNFNALAGSPYVLGQVLSSGSSYSMTLFFETNPTVKGWWLAIGGQWVGYYSSTLWSGATPSQTFETIGNAQLFGEIASTESTPCSDMGLGYVGSNASAARFGDTQYYTSAGVLTSTGVNLNTFRQGGGAPDANASAPYANTFGEGPAGSQRSFRYGGVMWNDAGTGLGIRGHVGSSCG